MAGYRKLTFCLSTKLDLNSPHCGPAKAVSNTANLCKWLGALWIFTKNRDCSYICYQLQKVTTRHFCKLDSHSTGPLTMACQDPAQKTTTTLQGFQEPGEAPSLRLGGPISSNDSQLTSRTPSRRGPKSLTCFTRTGSGRPLLFHLKMQSPSRLFAAKCLSFIQATPVNRLIGNREKDKAILFVDGGLAVAVLPFLYPVRSLR